MDRVGMTRPAVVGSDGLLVRTLGEHLGKSLLNTFAQTCMRVEKDVANEVKATCTYRKYLVVFFNNKVQIAGEIFANLVQKMM